MSDETTVIRNAAWVVAWDERGGGHVYLNGADVVFAGHTIVFVGHGYDGRAQTEVDGRGLLVLPGLIDVHSHPTSEPANKGLTDEVGSPGLYGSSLYEYMPVFRNGEHGYRAALEVALCELLLSGVTTVVDLSVAHEGWLDALAASGLRACAAPMFRDARWFTRNGHVVEYEWDTAAGRRAFEEALGIVDAAAAHPSGRLSGMVAPAQVDTCSPELIRDAFAAAKERGVPFQIHAGQSVVEFHEITRRHGKTPLGWLDDLGVLGERTIIGHGIFLDEHPWVHWPTRHDLKRLAASGTTVAHCPTVFARRGITLRTFGGYVRAGVHVAIGTDTFPHNMLDELRLALYLSRAIAGYVDDVRVTDAFNAATVAGARALGRRDLGRLAPGCKADLVLVDLHHPMMRPAREPVRSLVLAAADRAVRDVYVDGRRVVADGCVLTLDYADAAARLEEAQRRNLEDAPERDWAKRPVEELAPMAFRTAG